MCAVCAWVGCARDRVACDSLIHYSCLHVLFFGVFVCVCVFARKRHAEDMRRGCRIAETEGRPQRFIYNKDYGKPWAIKMHKERRRSREIVSMYTLCALTIIIIIITSQFLLKGHFCRKDRISNGRRNAYSILTVCARIIQMNGKWLME